MDEEYKKLLEENLVLNKENNKMLYKLVSYQKWNIVYKIVYWAIIILTALGAFYFLMPLFNNLVSVYTGGVGTSDVKNLGDLRNSNNSNSIKDLINSL